MAKYSQFVTNKVLFIDIINVWFMAELRHIHILSLVEQDIAPVIWRLEKSMFPCRTKMAFVNPPFKCGIYKACSCGVGALLWKQDGSVILVMSFAFIFTAFQHLENSLNSLAAN